MRFRSPRQLRQTDLTHPLPRGAGSTPLRLSTMRTWGVFLYPGPMPEIADWGTARAEHVRVDVTGRFAPGEPGLLTEMRRAPHGWECYVIYLSQHQGEGGRPVTQVHQGWVPSTQVQPMTIPPRS